MPRFHFERQTFRPADAYVISGYSPDNQRNLRRAGHIGKDGDGWTSYSLDEMAGLFVMGQLSELGVPPSASKDVAKSAGVQILLFAFDLPGSIEDRERANTLEEKPLAQLQSKRRFLVWQDGKGHFLDSLDDGFHS